MVIFRQCYISALQCTMLGLCVWLLGGAPQQAHALEDEEGPFLRNLLRRAHDLNYQYSSNPENLTDARWESAKVYISDSRGRVILSFDYQGEYYSSSSYYREHILNLKGRDGFRIRRLLRGALPKIPEPSSKRQIFLRSVSDAIVQERLLAMDLISYFDGEEMPQWMSRLYLMMDNPSPTAAIQFLPIEISTVPDSEAQFLPMVSLEHSQIGSTIDLHYLRYLVPAHMTTVESEAGPQLGIDMEAAYEILQKYRRFAVSINPSSKTTVILPSIYDGKDIISDVALEIYALSSYIQGFLSWYTPIWWAEYPLAQTILLKRSQSDAKGYELDLFKYRAQQCGDTVTKDLSSR